MRSLADPCMSRRRGLGAVSFMGTEHVEKTKETVPKGLSSAPICYTAATLVKDR